MTSRCRYDTTKRSVCQEVLTVAREALDTRQPNHGSISFTGYRALDDGHYAVEFVLAHQPDVTIEVDCAAEACVARAAAP